MISSHANLFLSRTTRVQLLTLRTLTQIFCVWYTYPLRHCELWVPSWVLQKQTFTLGRTEASTGWGHHNHGLNCVTFFLQVPYLPWLCRFHMVLYCKYWVTSTFRLCLFPLHQLQSHLYLLLYILSWDRSHQVAQAGSKLTLWPRQAFNLLSSCFNLSNTWDWITGPALDYTFSTLWDAWEYKTF